MALPACVFDVEAPCLWAGTAGINIALVLIPMMTVGGLSDLIALCRLLLAHSTVLSTLPIPSAGSLLPHEHSV